MTIHQGKVCVYRHLSADSIFYVGKGACYRPFETSRRNAKWHGVVDNIGHFDVEIVAWFDTDTEARIAETREIKQHRPIANLMQNGLERSAEFKAFISKLHTGKTNSQRTRAKMAAVKKVHPVWNKGIPPTTEHRERLRVSAHKRAVIETGSGRIFESIHGAARALEIKKENIVSVLRGVTKTTGGGMKFKYAE